MVLLQRAGMQTLYVRQYYTSRTDYRALKHSLQQRQSKLLFLKNNHLSTMKTTLIPFFYLLFLSVLPNVLLAQNVGFQGKRAILKFDAVSAIAERAVVAEAEYVLNRNFSAFLIGNYSNRSYPQRLPGAKNRPEVPTDSVAKVSDIQVGLGVKVYFSNAMPAPKRNYFFVSYQLGSANVKGNYFDYNATTPDKEGLYTYNLPAQSSRFTTGFGYQTFFWNRVAADFTMGIAMGALDVQQETSSIECDGNCFLNGFSNNYGPNTLSFGNWRAGKAGGMGLNLQLKIGILLF
jgi:hypothetical protein